MKSAKWMLPVKLMLLSGLMAAQSLTNSKVVAQVPFDFMVNGKMIPAGECVVKATGATGQILEIGNLDAHKGVLALARHGETNVASGDTVLVFNHYGDRYFLSSIRIEGSTLTYQLPTGRAEKEMRAQNLTASQTTLLAALR